MSEIGELLLEGMENALAYAKGRPIAGTRATVVHVPAVDVRAIRNRLDMTQRSFAKAFGFSLSSVRNWEQGARRPEKAARLLLALIDRHPETVRETLDELGSVQPLTTGAWGRKGVWVRASQDGVFRPAGPKRVALPPVRLRPSPSQALCSGTSL